MSKTTPCKVECRAGWTGGARSITRSRVDTRRKRQQCCGELAPGAGFEPATIRLTVECSTAELSGNKAKQAFASGPAYNKGFCRCKGPIARLQLWSSDRAKPAARQGISLPPCPVGKGPFRPFRYIRRAAK